MAHHEFSFGGTVKKKETLGSMSSNPNHSGGNALNAGAKMNLTAQPQISAFPNSFPNFNSSPPFTHSYTPAPLNPTVIISPLLARMNATKLNPFEDISAFKHSAPSLVSIDAISRQTAAKQNTVWDFDAIDSRLTTDTADIFDIGFLNGKNTTSVQKAESIDDMFASFNVSSQPRDRNMTASTDQNIDDIFSSFDRAPPIAQASLTTRSPPPQPSQPATKTPPPQNDTSRDELISLILSKGFPLQSILSALDLTQNDPKLTLQLLQEDHAIRYPNSSHPSTPAHSLHSSPNPSPSPTHSYTSQPYSSYSSVVDSASKYGLSFVMGAKKVLDASRKKLVGVVNSMQIEDEYREESYATRGRRDEIEADRASRNSYRNDSPIHAPSPSKPQRRVDLIDAVVPEPPRDERVSDLLNMNDDQPLTTFTPRTQFSANPIIRSSQPAQHPSDFYRDHGNTLFKSGQYPESIDLYTQALTHLPPSDPRTILILNNRALAYLKTGQSRYAVEDCTASIEAQGSVKSDQISKSYFRRGAAVVFDAKGDAGEDYRVAIGGDASGTNITAAREGLARCLHALKVTNTLQSRTIATPSKKTAESVERTVAEAVEKLRAGHRQLDAEDDQRMLHIDQVDARINTWKSGKETNLRALLCGLQDVLWGELAWQPVALSDLITPAQVKVKYMRAIAKVHPDKVGGVSVERRMISNGVFSVLNNAWDTFKTQNTMK